MIELLLVLLENVLCVVAGRMPGLSSGLRHADHEARFGTILRWPDLKRIGMCVRSCLALHRHDDKQAYIEAPRCAFKPTSPLQVHPSKILLKNLKKQPHIYRNSVYTEWSP